MILKRALSVLYIIGVIFAMPGSALAAPSDSPRQSTVKEYADFKEFKEAGWVAWHPLYFSYLSPLKREFTVKIELTTDNAGEIVKKSVVKSSSFPKLDQDTLSWIKANKWHGPPNAHVIVPVIYSEKS